MSLQAQPQQPAQVYPTTVTNQPSNNSHHSNGSFGTVFIILAIILVISTVACFLGRLCNRRYNNNKNHHHSHHQSQRPGSNSNKQQQIHNFQPREEGDIEFGDDKRTPPPTTARPNKGISPPFHGPAGTGSLHPPPNNYGNNVRDFEMKSDHEGELRSSV